MIRKIIAVAFVAALALAAIPAGEAQQFAAGTLLEPTDGDVVPVLTNLARNVFVFVDLDGDGNYDANEPVYLTAGAGNLASNDLRITSTDNFQAGTKVRTTDSDFNNPTIVTGFTSALRYYDADGNNVFNDGDTLYIDAVGANTVGVGDIRLTTSGSHQAGTTVRSGDADINLGLIATGLGGMADFVYWDINGDNSFNQDDVVYFNHNARALPTNPAVNDVRVSTGPTGAFGEIIDATANDVVPTLTAIAAGTLDRFVFVDLDGDGAYDAGEPVYLADTGTNNLQANDVRVSATDNFQAGSKVRTTDSDFNNPITALPAQTMQYYDADGNGVFNDGDTLYIDAVGANTVGVGDVRLTEFGSHQAGTTVRAGDQDVNLGVIATQAGGTLGTVADFFFWDINGDGSFNQDDLLYWDHETTASTNPSVNDVRASSGATGTFGEILSVESNDVVAVAQNLARNTFVYVDLDGDGAYDAGEPVYLTTGGANIVANDIRITSTDNFAAGTKVRTTDSDFNNPAATAGLASTLRYYDADGNAVFNEGDTLYIDAVGAGTIGVGDIRLTSFGSHQGGTTVRSGDQDINLGVIAPTGTMASFVFWDVNGDGAFNQEDIVYWDHETAAPATINPSVNDVRITEATVRAGGPSGPGASPSPTTTTSPSPTETGDASPTPTETGDASPTPTDTGAASPTPTDTGAASPTPTDDEEEPTPGFGLVAILAAFGLLAVALRRRF